jgi:4-carboxymuconolactone decarboxylase
MKSFIGLFAVIGLAILLSQMGCASLKEGGQERVRLKEPRVKPLAESEWTEEQRKILTPLKRNGRDLNIFATIARHPKMTQGWLPLIFYVLRESTLPPRDREILILRIGWLCRSEYEFGQHTLMGKSAGLSSEEISRITEGPNASGWDPFEATLLRAADELHSDAFITEATWNALAKRYDEKQLMDLIMTVGQYNMVSMVLNTLGVQLDEGVPGFPSGKDK